MTTKRKAILFNVDLRDQAVEVVPEIRFIPERCAKKVKVNGIQTETWWYFDIW